MFDHGYYGQTYNLFLSRTQRNPRKIADNLYEAFIPDPGRIEKIFKILKLTKS